jgi:hypothetical protein
MNSEEKMAEVVLHRTLLAVRSARIKRRVVKGVLAGGALMVSAVALFSRPPATAREAVAKLEPPPPVPSSPAVEERLAVMVWRDGTPRLEWVGLRELGALELQFSLDPVLAFAEDGR